MRAEVSCFSTASDVDIKSLFRKWVIRRSLTHVRGDFWLLLKNLCLCSQHPSIFFFIIIFKVFSYRGIFKDFVIRFNPCSKSTARYFLHGVTNTGCSKSKPRQKLKVLFEHRQLVST